jgi:hypothetical protein
MGTLLGWFPVRSQKAVHKRGRCWHPGDFKNIEPGNVRGLFAVRAHKVGCSTEKVLVHRRLLTEGGGSTEGDVFKRSRLILGLMGCSLSHLW